MALGGGGFKLAGWIGGALPVLLMVLAQGGAAVPLGVCLGGQWVIGVCLVGGALVASGIVLMMVGARDFVFIARNSAMLKR